MTASTASPSDSGEVPSSADPDEICYSPVELAAKFKLGKQTIIRWLKDPNHPLKGYKMGNNTWRIPASSVKAYLEGVYGDGRQNSY